MLRWSGFAYLCFISLLSGQVVSEILPRAAESLLLDAALAGERIVVVGERGHVLVSDDDGVSWKQVAVPTREMLTGVSFSDETHGVAVGHQNTILVTRDRGNTWTLQHIEPEYDVIFFDILMLNNNRGFAIGAYGEFWETVNGGDSWSQRYISDFDYHHNAIAVSEDGTLYIAGESGAFLVSEDRGENWIEMESPYYGSYHGLLPVGTSRILLYGLRGHIFLSKDRGNTWIDQSVESGGIVSAGARLDSNTLVLAGQGGNFFISRDHGLTFRPHRIPELDSIVQVIKTPQGGLLVLGSRGIQRYRQNEVKDLVSGKMQ